jgi:hypothetical protein
MIMRRVPGSKAGVVVQVAVDHRGWRHRDGARRSCRDSEQRERKNQMGQSAKQPHGREANQPHGASQPGAGVSTAAHRKPLYR